MRKEYMGCQYEVVKNQGSAGGWSVTALTDDDTAASRWPPDEIVAEWLGAKIRETITSWENTLEAIYLTEKRGKNEH